jgi:hypothetical protein
MPDSKHQMMIDIHRHLQQITFIRYRWKSFNVITVNVFIRFIIYMFKLTNILITNFNDIAKHSLIVIIWLMLSVKYGNKI